jgi:excisionase family DNA binding protein
MLYCIKPIKPIKTIYNACRMDYVSTGQVAKMLSVTSDTVVKWVRKGKLRAMKTAGGHYRIPRDSVLALLPGVDDFGRNNDKRPLVPCWECNAAAGKIRENCRTCPVFRAKGGKCYEVGKILKEKRQGATCCPTDCEECSYYKEQRQRTVNVLVFTDNESLLKESDSSRIRLQFSRCEYDCSLVVDSFRPEYVIVDCSKDLDQCEELCQHLANDPRIPGVEIILAMPPGSKTETRLRGGVAIIDQPFGISEVEKLVENFDLVRKL